MSKSSTTHVIELETGIGEPTFIPLVVGQELQPISLGKKGMWKIESVGVLDVHAFMYFDGTALFLQSADEGVAAAVDGYRVGKAWTELHAPCKIDIGTARLRFRCLADEAAEHAARVETERLDAQRREAQRLETEYVEAQRVEAQRHEAQRVEAQRHEAQRRIRAQTGPPPPGPLSFPKNDRSFSSDYPEPYGRRVAMTGPPAPRSQYGSEYAGTAPNHTAHRGQDPMLAGTSAPLPHYTAPTPHHGHRYAPTGPHMPGMQPMYAGPGSAGYPPHGRGHPSASAPYNSGPPGYSAMTSGQVGRAHAGSGGYFAKYADLSTPKRVLVVLAPFCLAAAAYLVLFDTPARSTTTVDAGTEAPGAAVQSPQPVQLPPLQQPPPPVQAQTPPVQPPQAPAAPQAPPQGPLVAATAQCPPGFVPYAMMPVSPGGAVPCVLAATPAPVPASPPTMTPPYTPTTDPSAAAAAAAFAMRTLERQAVDFVAVNDYAHAAAVYELLQQQNPSNRVYAEAARILHVKADAGTLP